MAFTRQLNATLKSHDGTTYRVDVDRDGSVSTDHEVRLDGFQVAYGQQGAGIFDVIADTRATANLAIEQSQSAALDAIRAIRSWDTYEGRMEITNTDDSSIAFKGLVLPGQVRTRLTGETQIVSLTAKGRIQSLDTPFVENDGTKWGAGGQKTLIEAIGKCLGKLPFSVNILAHLNWWPWNLTDSTDLWTIKVPTEPYYSRDAEGTLQAASHIEVLRDLLDSFGLRIALWDNHFYLWQPSELNSGGSLTFREYDLSGTFQQEVSKTSAFTLQNDEPFVSGSDQLQARRPVRKYVSTFESGEPEGDVVDNSGFEARKESFSRGVVDVDSSLGWVRINGNVEGRIEVGDIVQWSGGTSSQNGFYTVQAVSTGSNATYGTFTQVSVQEDITDETVGGTVAGFTTPKAWTEEGFTAEDRFIGHDGSDVNPSGDILSPHGSLGALAGNVSLGVQITEAASDSYTDDEWNSSHELTDTALTWWASQNLGAFSAGQTRTISFTAGIYMERLTAATIGVEDRWAHGYYAIVQDDGGTDKYYDAENETWTTTKTPIAITGGPVTDSGSNFVARHDPRVEHSLTIQAGFPSGGDVEIRFYGGILRGRTDDPTGWQGWILYDEVAFEPVGQEPGVAAWAYELTGPASDGPTEEASVRQGDVPHDRYESGLRLPDDTLTSNWKVGPYTSSEVSDTAESGKSLRQLRAEERLRVLKQSRRSITVEFTSPPDAVTPWSAMDVDGDRYLPVHFRHKEPSGHISVTYVEIPYNAVPTDVEQIVETFGGAAAGQTATASDVLASDLDAILQDIKATQAAEVLSKGSAVTSIDVDALPTGYPDGTAFTLVNTGTAKRFTITLDGPVTAGDTTLSIDSFSPDERIEPGSVIYRGGAETATYIEETRQAIRSQTASNQIAELAEDVSGEVSAIPITGMKADIIIGEDLAVLNQETGETYEVTASKTQPISSGTTQLSIEGDRDTGTARVIANAGDPVLVPGGWRQAYELITPDQIKTDVREERTRRSVAQLSSDINDTGITSLPVQYLDTPLDAGQKIELIRLKYADDPVGILVPDVNVYEIEVASDTPASASSTSIPIVSDNLVSETGDPVYVRNSEMNSQIIQNADSIVLKVSEGNVASQLTIELESITADTDIFKDDDWDGSVDSSGSITAFASTASWAITGKGHFEFTDGTTAFRFNGTDFVFTVQGGDVKIDKSGGLILGLSDSLLTIGDPGRQRRQLSMEDSEGTIFGSLETFGSGLVVLASHDQSGGLVNSGAMHISADDRLQLSGSPIELDTQIDASSLPDIGSAGSNELGVDTNGFVKRA